MISQLVGSGRPLTIQSKPDQWTLVKRLFAYAEADARKAAQAQRAALEFVAYLVLERVKSTLSMVEATNVRMLNGHAVIPLGQVSGTDQRVMPVDVNAAGNALVLSKTDTVVYEVVLGSIAGALIATSCRPIATAAPFGRGCLALSHGGRDRVIIVVDSDSDDSADGLYQT